MRPTTAKIEFYADISENGGVMYRYRAVAGGDIIESTGSTIADAQRRLDIQFQLWRKKELSRDTT